MPSALTPSQFDAWRREGCLVLPGFATREAIDALARRAHELVAAFEPPSISHQAPVFSSRDRAALNQRELVASAGEVRCFFEEEALDGQGRLVVPKARAINKIGHALHDREPHDAKAAAALPVHRGGGAAAEEAVKDEVAWTRRNMRRKASSRLIRIRVH